VLLGSARTKAARRMLMKWTLRVSMVTVLTLFGCQGFIDSFRQLVATVQRQKLIGRPDIIKFELLSAKTR